MGLGMTSTHNIRLEPRASYHAKSNITDIEKNYLSMDFSYIAFIHALWESSYKIASCFRHSKLALGSVAQ